MLVREIDDAFVEIESQMKESSRIAKREAEQDRINQEASAGSYGTAVKKNRVDLRELLLRNNTLQKSPEPPNTKFGILKYLDRSRVLLRFLIILSFQTIIIFTSACVGIRNKFVLVISSTLMYHIIMQNIYKTNVFTTVAAPPEV